MTDEYEMALRALEDLRPLSSAELKALSRVLGADVTVRHVADVREAAWLLNTVLPGWWFSVGLCTLSGDASIGPDFRAPNAPPKAVIDKYDAGFHADLQPGDGLHRMARALLHCIVQAKQAMKADGYE